MSATSRLAVEITKLDDSLSIWVDANNNGIRDDDDVNIFVTKAGGFYTESPTFKAALDAHLTEKLKTASLALLETFPNSDPVKENEICDIALALVVKAVNGEGQIIDHDHLPPLPEKIGTRAHAPSSSAQQPAPTGDMGIFLPKK
jgi:hypothetical protein